MDQKTLASMLNISPGMVSKLKKRGMPVDTFERAQRWRKRHLEPGRVKGVRLDPMAPTTTHRPAPPPPPAQPNLYAIAGALAKAVDAELQVDAGPIDLEPLRNCLRAMHRPFPPMSIRVWVALVDTYLADDSRVRSHPDPGLPVTADEFCDLTSSVPGFGDLWAEFACYPIAGDAEIEDDDWS